MIVWTITSKNSETSDDAGSADTLDLAVDEAITAALDYFTAHAEDPIGSVALTIVVGDSYAIAGPGYDENGVYAPDSTRAGLLYLGDGLAYRYPAVWGLSFTGDRDCWSAARA